MSHLMLVLGVCTDCLFNLSYTHIHGTQKIHPVDFCDLLNFVIVPRVVCYIFFTAYFYCHDQVKILTFLFLHLPNLKLSSASAVSLQALFKKVHGLKSMVPMYLGCVHLHFAS